MAYKGIFKNTGKVISLVFLFSVLLGVILLVGKPQLFNSGASDSGRRCSEIKKERICNIVKSQGFSCGWKDGKCVSVGSSETTVVTSTFPPTSGGTLPSCSNVVGREIASPYDGSYYCTVPPQIPGSRACILNGQTSYCCPNNTHLEGTYDLRRCVPN